MPVEFPIGPVPLNSPFYIERYPLEELAKKEIEQPGSVVRIKAPIKMGKSSLFARIIAHAQNLGYKTVSLDFQQADNSVFANLEQFLRWFCANISRQLGLKPILDDYWDRDMGSKVSCTIYFETYLLEQINSPLVLTLNEVNRVFEHPQIAQEFLPLLRFWHEQAKQVEVFSKLRLMVVHSTEIYVSLNLHQSPFNVGLTLKLPEFTWEQVQKLALLHGLNWAEGEVGKQRLDKLLTMIGGHPYLVRVALYHLSRSEVTLEELLQKAPTQEGIYSDYLRTHLAKVEQDPELTAALKKLIAAKQSIQLQPILAYKLESMGLVKLNGDQCTLSCQLYRLYFEAQNLKREDGKNCLIQELRPESNKLNDSINIEPLTQISHRRYFNRYLQTEWQRTARGRIPLSLSSWELEKVELYHDTHGHPKINAEWERRAFLNIIGDFESGFIVNLEIVKEDNSRQMVKSGTLPPAPELLEYLQIWQHEYRKWGNRNSRITGKKVIATSAKPTKLHPSAKQLAASFQNWLQSVGFQDVNLRLREVLNTEEKIRIWLCSNNQQLHQLPWCTWNFLERYEPVELALSQLDFDEVSRFSSCKNISKVKILAVFGNSQGINLEPDRQLLSNLSDAEVVFLVEPQREELYDRLWSESWDIVFFAGHSQTIQQQGILYINQEDILTIEDLKYALKKAIKQGLQLAIFNSCDGLGLLYELGKLSLPNAIVMREQIVDEIAHKFLQYFLAIYAQGYSLPLATRRARERLQTWEQKYPCSSWLPVLYQHQSAISPLWNDLKFGVNNQSIPITNQPKIRIQKRKKWQFLQLFLVGGIGTITTILILLLQTWGWLQTWELNAFDRALSWQVAEPADQRFLVITVDDQDITYQREQGMNLQGSLADAALVELLNKLEPLEPKTIALDIIHDFPFSQELANKINEINNFIGICRVENQKSKFNDIKPPPELASNRIGFSNLALDSDGVIRRQIIGMTSGKTCQSDLSLSLRLALDYLDNYEVKRDQDSGVLIIGDTVFPRLNATSGAYNLPDTENGGYQILLNYRSLSPPTVALREVIQGQKDSELAELVTGKIILIGVKGPNIDLHYTPYSQSLQTKRMLGVFIHAQATSNIISAVLDQRPVLWWFPNWVEGFWISLWSLVGAGIAVVWRIPQNRAIAITLALVILYGCYYFLLTFSGGWILLIAPGIALITAALINSMVLKMINSNFLWSRLKGKD
ncbi:MAG: AAA-like domain-containing protein [Xenococcus sp. MO_188.B8]|nr:AAA-like domain-containing protein [Xenococcus sp. MO_188.B8]